MASKMIGGIKQRVLEGVGQASKTPDSEETKKAKERLDALKKHYDKMFHLSKKYTTEGGKLASTGSAMAEAFANFGLVESDGPTGRTLQKIADAQKSLDAMQQALMTQANEVLVGPLQKFYDVDIKQAMSSKTNHEKSRFELDGQLNTLKSLEKKGDPVKLQMQEEKTNVARAHYERCSHEIEDKVSALNAVSSYHLMENLRDYMNAQLSFFAEGYTLLHELEPFLESLQADIDKMREKALSAPPVREAGTVDYGSAGGDTAPPPTYDAPPPTYGGGPAQGGYGGGGAPPPAYGGGGSGGGYGGPPPQGGGYGGPPPQGGGYGGPPP
eukprot:CAMPEP_0177652174 /NCGR_PEP_ID=MMETSP0447-20121125/12967_1 /TAXON_ID=0 /ORGANISM="Stygamoeba regulata, Strain BSH-02190019" /LENGTH=326 /DNA_ID=CAMNT_0019155357 /DNA_START=160 /DNA_END=1136 /DNA_ORIENTATION=-